MRVVSPKGHTVLELLDYNRDELYFIAKVVACAKGKHLGKEIKLKFVDLRNFKPLTHNPLAEALFGIKG